MISNSARRSAVPTTMTKAGPTGSPGAGHSVCYKRVTPARCAVRRGHAAVQS